MKQVEKKEFDYLNKKEKFWLKKVYWFLREDIFIILMNKFLIVTKDYKSSRI